MNCSTSFSFNQRQLERQLIHRSVECILLWTTVTATVSWV